MLKAMFISWLLDRLKEKSTYQGAAIVAAAAGASLEPEQVEAITYAGAAVVGLIEMGRKEKAGGGDAT